VTLWRQIITERNAAITERCNNPVVFVLEASNLPLASQCVTLTDCQRVQKRTKTHTALGLREAAVQNEHNKIHISQRKTQLLVFSRMLAFLTSRGASERAARWSVSVYAAQLSPFTPFVVVLEREGLLNPSRSTSSKRFSSVSAT